MLVGGVFGEVDLYIGMRVWMCCWAGVCLYSSCLPVSVHDICSFNWLSLVVGLDGCVSIVRWGRWGCLQIIIA